MVKSEISLFRKFRSSKCCSAQIDSVRSHFFLQYRNNKPAFPGWSLFSLCGVVMVTVVSSPRVFLAFAR